MQDLERVKIAYKKFKANLYFDKSQLPLRDRVVLFEQDGIEEKLNELCNALMYGSDWSSYEQSILDQIGVLVYPKTLKSILDDAVIFNSDNVHIELETPQFFIDLPVEGHILATLWVLSVGAALDTNQNEDDPNGMYEHSYGNRLRKTLINKDSGDITYSPGLFEPYFAQYESWRDYGLEKAKERLDDKQDAIILTLDFKSFYYSVHLDEKCFQRFLGRVKDRQPWHTRVNDFIFKVICRYSDKLRKVIGNTSPLDIGQRNVLPIGFLPSNILSNWVLTSFDDAIIAKWNPVYYGRYVDDIIIVDKVEKNDPLYKLARQMDQSCRLTADYVIRKKLVENEIFTVDKTHPDIYQINEKALVCNENIIQVQSKKVKLFYFRSGATRALLDCFKTKIAQNASEFRLLPDMDTILKRHNYSEIFDLRNEESINKFRGITGIELDKFALSKFLGKYQKVSGMIDSSEENQFEKDLMLILDERTLISNYSTWERLFEILILNKRYDLYKKLALRIVDALSKYYVPEGICNAEVKTHDALLRVFLAALQRTAAIAWGKDFDRKIDEICEKLNELREDNRITIAVVTGFDAESIKNSRKAYCTSRMVNKYLLPLPIDCVLKNLKGDSTVNLGCLDDMLQMMDTSWLDCNGSASGYIYYPYIVTPHELSFVLICKELTAHNTSFDPYEQQESINKYFKLKNYPWSDEITQKAFCLEEVESTFWKESYGRDLFLTQVACDERSTKDELLIAVGSVRLSKNNFTHVLDGHPNRGYERYKEFARIFDEAVHGKADMLVLPENFLPFEWIPIVTRLCASNNLALITGIEHFVVKDPGKQNNGFVYNITATILPYKHEHYTFASVSYHNKVAYSPREKEYIIGRRYMFKEGNIYQLFGWNNVWFPVYCCFELASIHDRGLFQTYADMVIAVEWNKDTPYYSNIIESLSRDLHCYCIQANSSDYGDSRIVAPKDSASKDIVRTKGGLNACALIDRIDIKALRDFQMLEFPLQKESKAFKPSPPCIDPDGIIQAKRQNRLPQFICHNCDSLHSHEI